MGRRMVIVTQMRAGHIIRSGRSWHRQQKLLQRLAGTRRRK